jgi:hypothetical protein
VPFWKGILAAGAAYAISEFIKNEYLLGRRELAAEKFGARQWWSYLKKLGSSSGRGLDLKLLLCV